MAVPDPSSIERESKEPLVKCRYFAILMGFIAQFFFNSHEIAMNAGIVAMVNRSAVANPQDEITSNSCLYLMSKFSDEERNPAETFKTVDGEFLWDANLQRYIFGCSLLCFLMSIAPAGKTTGAVGCKKMLFWATFFPSVLTFITPLAAWCGIYVVIFIQGLRGVAQAGIIPAQSVLIANWCPKTERGLSYTIMLTGTAWGTLIGSQVAGLLGQMLGWSSIFYILGAIGIVVSLFLGYAMHDNPRVHPHITNEEFHCIVSSHEYGLSQKRPDTPWGRLFSCIPFYALCFAYFGQMWALFYFFTVIPQYQKIVLLHSMEQNGLYTILPFFLQIKTSLVAGWLSFYFNRKKFMNVDKARKFWNLISCFGYSISLLGIYFAGCNRTASVAFSVLSFSCTGFAYAGCWITPTDMSPTFAGSVNAMAYVFGLCSNLILPIIVGFIKHGTQTIEEWNKILFITIGVVLSSGIVFAIFGSANVQPWNIVELKSGFNVYSRKTMTISPSGKRHFAKTITY